MEILNTYTVNTNENALIAAIFLGMVFIIFVILAVSEYVYSGFNGTAFWFLVGTVLTLGLSIAAATSYASKDSIQTRYEVTIESMSQFDYSRYEIVEQKGKIFTVIDHNPEKQQ